MSTDNIKVIIKIRPLIAREKNENAKEEWTVDETGKVKSTTRGHAFAFDHIFDKETKIQQVFEVVAKPIIGNALNGINGTIFAYGQTSSGKTYCISGSEEEPGIVPLTVKEIFEQINTMEDREFLIRVGYIEIYNEKIFDLLDSSKPEVTRIFEPQPGEVKICQVEVTASSAEVMIEHFNHGNSTKRTGETAMNERSSRSHAIFSITIESREKGNIDGECRVSTLYLVDLAGSERADQTKATGERLNESKHINKSLLTLGKVIRELSSGGIGGINEFGDKYISYRDSKLTRLLSASLGGNAKTAIICTITPATFDETYSTLTFANSAKNIKNKPVVNRIVSDKVIMNRLYKEIERLKAKLNEKEIHQKTRDTGNSGERSSERNQLIYKIMERESQIIHGSHSNLVNSFKSNRRRTWMCSSPIDEYQPSLIPKACSVTPTITVVPPPPFILRNTENGPEITFSLQNNESIAEETFKASNEVDFECFNDPMQNLLVNDDEMARRLRTPRAFKKNILLPNSPQIIKPSEMTPEQEIEYLKSVNQHLIDELRELEDFKKIEDLCTARNSNVQAQLNEMCGKLSEREAEIEKLIKENADQAKEISELKELEIKMQLIENDCKKAVKERQDKENILASIQYEYDQYKVRSKYREEELVQSLNEVRDDTTVVEKIKTLEEILKKTEVELFELQAQKSSSIEKESLKISEMDKKLKELENELQMEKKSRKDLEGLLKERSEEFEKTSDQLMDAIQDNEKLTKDMDEVKELLSEKVLKVQELQTELSKSQEIVLHYKQIQELLQNQDFHDKADDDIGKVINKLLEIASKHGSLEVEKLQLMQEIESMRAAAFELTDKLLASQTLNDAESMLTEKVESLSEDLQKSAEKVQEYEKLISEMKDLIKKIKDDHKDALASKMSLQKDNENLQDKVQGLEKAIVECEGKIADLENANSTLLKEVQGKMSDNKITELEGLIEKGRNDYEIVVASKGELQKELEIVQTKLQESEKVLADYEQKIVDLENANSSVLKNMEIVQEANDLAKILNLETLIEKNKVDYEEVITAKEDLQKEYENLQVKLREAESTITEYKQRIIDLENENSTSTETLAKQNNEVAHLNECIQKSHSEYDAVVASKEELQKEQECLQIKLQDSEKIVAEYCQKIADLEKINRDLSRNLEMIQGADRNAELEELIEKSRCEYEAVIASKEELQKEQECLHIKLQDSEKVISEYCQKIIDLEKANSDLSRNLETIHKVNNADKITDLEELIEKSRCEYEAVLASKEELRKEQENLHIKLQDSERIIAEYHQKIVDLEKINSELSKNLDTIQGADRNAELEELIEKSRCEYEAVIASTEELQKEQECLHIKLQDSEKVIAEYCLKIADLEKANRELSIQGANSADRITDLEELIEKSRCEYELVCASREDLQKQLECLNIKLRESEKTSQELQQNLDTLCIEITAKDKRVNENCLRLEAKNIDLKETLQSYEKDMALDKEKISNLRVENEKLLAEVNSLNESKLLVECELEKLKASQSENNKQLCTIEKLSSELSEMTYKLEMFETEISDLTTKNENLMDIVDQKNNLINELESVNSELVDKCKNLEISAVEVKGECEKLMAQCQTQMDQLKTKTTENDELKTQFRRRSQDNDRKFKELEMTNNKLLQEVGAVEASKRQIEAELIKAKESCSLHEAKLKKLTADIENYQQESELLKKQIKIINESLAQQTSENFLLSQKSSELQQKNEKLADEVESIKSLSKKPISPTSVSNRRSGEHIENEAFVLQHRQLQIESNHGTPVRAMKSNLDRKTRRQSIHDERRRLSAWEQTSEAETQTDGVGESCACVQLAEKVNELQIEVRKKQMMINNAERMAKCNPLKVDLQEMKIKYEREQSDNKILKSSLENLKEELSKLRNDHIPKLQAEYNSIFNEKCAVEKKLCEAKRHLKMSTEKENVGVNTSFNNNLQSNGDDLKAKYEMMEEHLEALNKKYDMAKRLLNLRLDDLNKMRSEKTEQNQTIMKLTLKYEDCKRLLILYKEKTAILRNRLGEAPNGDADEFDEQNIIS